MQTNWGVIGGAPGSGKTSIVTLFAARGFKVRQEGATKCIEALMATGKTKEQITAFENQPDLQAAIARTNHELELEIAHEPHEFHIWDRCVVETLAYCRLYRHGDERVRPFITRRFRQRVMLLDRLPIKPNHVRCEDDETAAQLDILIEEVYRAEGYEVVRIPVPIHPDRGVPEDQRIAWSIAQRVEIILGHWGF